MVKGEELEIALDKYIIKIYGPFNFGESRVYSTNEFGAGCIKVYKVLEGGTPNYPHDVKHLTYVGGFHLREKSGKTPGEFMKEIRNGLAE